MEASNYYKTHYPSLEQALKGGARIHIFRSGSGLRVVRVEHGDALISYGEFPWLAGALIHAEEDFGLDYDAQYCGIDAKREHRIFGGSSIPADLIDLWINQGNTLDLWFSNKKHLFYCSRNIYNGRYIFVGYSKGSILDSMLYCIAKTKAMSKREYNELS